MNTKKLLSPADVEAQTTLELPDRHTLCGLIHVQIATIDVLTNNVVQVLNFNFDDIQAAVAVCNLVNQVNVLNQQVGNNTATQTCVISQTLASITD